MSNESYKETQRIRRGEVPVEDMPTAEQAMPGAEQQREWAAMLNSALPQPAATTPPPGAPAPEQPQYQPQPQFQVRPPRRRFRGGMLAGAAAFGIVGLLAGVLLAKPWATHTPINATTAGAAVVTSAGGTGTGTGATPAAPKSNTPAPAAAASSGNVQIVRQGYAQLPVQPGDDPKVAYAVILHNPRGSLIAADVHAIITFTSRNGVPIEVKDEDLNALLPGETSAVDGDVDGVAGQMSVRVVVNRWVPGQGLASGLTTGGIRTGQAADGDGLTTVATVHSTLGRNLSDVKVVTVYYNRAGRIIGGGDDKIDFLPAGGTAPATIDASHVAPGVARTEVYANPDGMFVVPDTSD